MLLRGPSKKNIQRWLEDAGNNPKGFGKMMIPRSKVELPEFATVAITMAKVAQDTYREKGHITHEEIHAIVIESWMGALRLLELAALEGARLQEEMQEHESIANKEACELIARCTLNTRKGGGSA
jgi:hypothetical protein